uniref:Myb/SANT-like DNA-binding domain-containing protein n=1 Tax=Hyalomma excavatum TaxID=257692 RepID=A0A131XBU7_9ACAR
MALNFSGDDYGSFKGRLGRGCSWTREETLLLLDLYEKERLNDERADYPPHNTPKYQKVHQAISGFLGAHGYSRTPMQVRERLKRLKRDFRENRHGEFTDRVGTILAKRAALGAPASPPNGSVAVASVAGSHSSPEHSLEACCPAVLVKTELGTPEQQQTSQSSTLRNPRADWQPLPVVRAPEPSARVEKQRPEEPAERPVVAASSNGSPRARRTLQQRVVRLLGQLLAESRRQTQAAEAFQQQLLYQMHLISCSLQVLAAGSPQGPLKRDDAS